MGQRTGTWVVPDESDSATVLVTDCREARDAIRVLPTALALGYWRRGGTTRRGRAAAGTSRP